MVLNFRVQATSRSNLCQFWKYFKGVGVENDRIPKKYDIFSHGRSRFNLLSFGNKLVATARRQQEATEIEQTAPLK